MRRLNGKLFLILLASVTVGGALVHALHAFQVHRHSGMFLREAERAEKENHFEQSAENLRRYLLLSPSDTDVTARLAKLLFEHRQDRQALLLYSQVVQQQPGNDEARRRVVDISLRLGAYQDAKYHLDNFLIKSHAAEGELYLQLGSCQQALGDYIGARASFEKAIQLGPNLTGAYARLATLLVDRLDKGNEAKAQLDDMIRRNPKNADAYLLRAAFLQAHAGNTQIQTAFLPKGSTMAAYERPLEMLRQALSDAKAALELTPNDSKAMLFAAQVAIACEKPEEARDFAQRALKINPGEPVAYVVLASNELRQDHQKNAIETLKRGLDATKGNSLVLLTLANLELDANDIEGARPLIDRLRKVEPFAPVVRYLDTRVLINQSQWAEAAQRLQGTSAELTRWPQFQKESQFWLAHCWAQLGRNDLRIAAYRGALDVDPFWPPARMGLAESLREAGRIDESLAEYQRLLRLPNIPPRATVAGLQLAVVKNLSLPLSDRSWSAIDKQLEQVSRRATNENRLVLNAQVAAAEGKIEESRHDLRAAIAADPKNSTAWINLLALEMRDKHWSDVEKLLVEMKKQFADGVPYRLGRAEYLVRHTGEAAKNELRSLAKAPAAYSKVEGQQLAAGMARAALEIKDYGEAERLCRLVAENDPANLQIRLVLFDLAQQAGRTEAMNSALEEVKAIEKDGFYSKYGEAVACFIKGQQNKDEKLLDKALEKAGEAKLLRPDWARSTLLIAEINDYRGRREAAIEGYTAALELGERDHRLLGRLVSLLYEQGSYAKAEALIKRLQDEKAPITIELTRLASHTSIQTGDVNRAVDMAEQTASNSKDVRDHIWLGQVLTISGKYDKAEAELKQATKDAPKFPGGWIELIRLYKTTGKLDQAQKALAEAKTKIDVKQTPLALPYACELLGQNHDAEQYYDDALKAAPGDNQIRQAMVDFQIKIGKINEAETILRQLIASSQESKDTKTLQASRRKLAGLLVTQAAYQKRAEARKLIDDNLTDAPKSEADLRMSALVDAAFATTEGRRKAIEQLESLSHLPGALATDDQLLLARLYWSAGQRTKARDLLRTLATQSRVPEYTLTYTEVLLDGNELSEAENWVHRLEELAPKQFGTVVARARLLAKQDHYDEAYDRLSRFITDDTGDPKARTLRRRLISTRFEEFGNDLTRRGRKQEAEKFYALAESWLPDVGGNPNRPTLLHVLFLIRRDRHNDAVAEIERMQQGKDMDSLAKACLAMAQVNINEHDVLERAVKVAEHLVGVRPSADSWIALGALQDRMENYDGAEQSYRHGLAIAAARIDALNNLAYILALRKKELPEARSLINRALENGGPRAALRDSLAMIELAMGDADAALSDADQACKEDPNPVHLFHLARLEMTKGNRDKANEAFDEARKRGLNPAALHPLERPTLSELESQLDHAPH